MEAHLHIPLQKTMRITQMLYKWYFITITYVVYMHRHNKYPFPIDEHFRIFLPLTIMDEAAMTSMYRTSDINAPLCLEVELLTDRLGIWTGMEVDTKHHSQAAI